jgi:sRNA-binding protein
MAGELGHSVSRVTHSTEIHRLEQVAHANDEVRRRRERQEQQKKRQKNKQQEKKRQEDTAEMEEDMDGRLLPGPEDEEDDGETHLDVLV